MVSPITSCFGAVPIELQNQEVFRTAGQRCTSALRRLDSHFNPTPNELLRQDFKLDLGIADVELPRDDAGLDVQAVWKAVSRAVKDIAIRILQRLESAV